MGLVEGQSLCDLLGCQVVIGRDLCRGHSPRLVGDDGKILVPIVLPEVKIGNLRERLPYLEHWAGEAESLEAIARNPKIIPGGKSWEEFRLVLEFKPHPTVLRRGEASAGAVRRCRLRREVGCASVFKEPDRAVRHATECSLYGSAGKSVEDGKSPPEPQRSRRVSRRLQDAAIHSGPESLSWECRPVREGDPAVWKRHGSARWGVRPSAAGRRPILRSRRPTWRSRRPTWAGDKSTWAGRRPTWRSRRPTWAGDKSIWAGHPASLLSRPVPGARRGGGAAASEGGRPA
jgi:hypothetical protein